MYSMSGRPVERRFRRSLFELHIGSVQQFIDGNDVHALSTELLQHQWIGVMHSVWSW
jgi:hypothetical protein